MVFLFRLNKPPPSTNPKPRSTQLHSMYRRCAVSAAAAAAPKTPFAALAHAHRRRAASTLAAGLGQRLNRSSMAAATGSSLPAPLSTHAATGQSASEFLDDPGLLRDQAYVNGKWVNAQGEATFAVEGTCVLRGGGVEWLVACLPAGTGLTRM